MSTSQTMNRSQSRKHYHQKSIEDFMKNMKKYNLRSERYISPKPLLYMYAKNNTAQTIERSRSKTLSNNKSPHSKSKRSKKDTKSSTRALKANLHKIFKQSLQPGSRQAAPVNPAVFIQRCGQKLKKSQKLLQGKSSIGSLLCKQFLSMLNEIVQKMVKQLDTQLKEIYSKTERQLEGKFTAKLEKMQRVQDRMGSKIRELTSRLDNNTQLIYWLRKESQMDIDYIFGQVVLGTDRCGGHGYSKNVDPQSESESRAASDLLFADRLKTVPHRKQLLVHHEPVRQGLVGYPKRQAQQGRLETQNNELSQQEYDIYYREERIRPAYNWQRQGQQRNQIAEEFADQPEQLQDRIRPKRKST